MKDFMSTIKGRALGFSAILRNLLIGVYSRMIVPMVLGNTLVMFIRRLRRERMRE
jgi:hypothetical protein